MSNVLNHRSLSSPVRLLGNIFSLALSAALCASGTAQSGERTLVRVEEDWVALIAEPDSATSSPQILNVISPTQSTSGVFGMVQVNHRGDPEFQGGGLQVQGWVGSSLSSSVQAGKTAILSRQADNLRYTVTMEQAANGIKFGLCNGLSRTWGHFADTAITVTVPAGSVNLDGYTPEFSTANSNVNLGKHRVDALYITAIRLVYSDGQTVTDNTDRVVHIYKLSVEDVPLGAYEANPDDYNVYITE